MAKVDCREINPPQFPEQVKYLLGFFGNGDSVGGEGEILGHVDSKELDAVCPLYHHHVDNEGAMGRPAVFPEVYHHLLCFADIE